MSIMPITNIQSPHYTPYKVSFKAGKTYVFADFDRTYTPYSHKDMCENDVFVNNQNKRNEFNNYFNRFKKLKDAAKDKFFLTITTGRNAAEYIFVENALREQHLNYYSPDGLITRDGADRFVKENQSWIKDGQKTKDVQALAKNWNGQTIKEAIKNIVLKNSKHTFILDAPINRTKWDYPGVSMQDELEKFNPYNIKNYASFNQDEDNIIEIAFSNKVPADKLKVLINNYLKEKNVASVILHYPKDNNAYFPQYDNGTVYYEPGNRMIIKPKIGDKEINKLYDVKEAVKNVVNNDTNDLVIAAGDEINDEEMLNPLNYIDILGVTPDRSKPVNYILENRDVLDAIYKLPLRFIIVGNSPNLEHLREMDRILKSKGIDRITCINSPDDPQNNLCNAIEKNMYKYADQNDEFSYYMGMDLFKHLLNTTNL